nr:integrase, catalytic region, zinc finger, CCHC-type, peptidase aspartic, catalytic [Tanacetum cinerariifolium]
QVQNDAGYNVFANHLQHSEQSKFNDQNDVESDDERVAFANLIDNLKLDVDENKKIQKQLKKANTTLAQELKERKAILSETSKSLGESISVRDSFLVALQTKQTEFEKYKDFNDCTIDYDKLKRKLNEALRQLAQKDTIIKEGLKTKSYELSVVKERHDELIKQSLLTKSHYEGLVKQKTKQEMHADLKYVESLEKEIDELESDKAEFSYMYDVILQECVSKDVMCSYLMSLSDLDALDELQCMYLYKVKECNYLTQKLSKQIEFVSKKVHTELLQCFAKVEKHSISLEIAMQKCKEQVKNDTVCNEKASNVFQKECEKYFKNQDLRAQLQDKNIAISELKKLIEKRQGKSVDTKFDRPFVVRQPNAQRIPKPSVSGKPAHFSNSLESIYFSKTKLVPKANVLEGLSKLVTAQTLPQTAKQPIVQLILFIVNSRCTKHMTGNLKLLCNFVKQFLGTVHFGNDQFALILGYGDLVQGNVMINRVYYVEGLNHNLFSVG